MNESEFQTELLDLIFFGQDENSGLEISQENVGLCTFEQEGLMTNDKGLVITLEDGSKFNLTIQKCSK